jgi:hypothetical protein
MLIFFMHFFLQSPILTHRDEINKKDRKSFLLSRQTFPLAGPPGIATDVAQIYIARCTRIYQAAKKRRLPAVADLTTTAGPVVSPG